MNANDVSALATAIQAALLVVAAAIALRQVGEARWSREGQSQPYVVISFEVHPDIPSMTRIAVKNIGATVARDVAIDFDPPLKSTMDRPGFYHVTDWLAIKDGIANLVPGQEMSCLFDSLISRYSNENLANLPRESKVKVTYSDDNPKKRKRKLYDREYILDFHVFYNLHYSDEKGISELAESVGELAKTIKSWTEDDGIMVYTKDLDQSRKERVEEAHAAIERWNERAKLQAGNTEEEGTKLEASEGETPAAENS